MQGNVSSRPALIASRAFAIAAVAAQQVARGVGVLHVSQSRHLGPRAGLHAIRWLADRRVWTAIDITQSGTRREELLHDPDTYHAVTMIRRTLNSMNPVDAMEQLTKQLSRFQSNQEFLRLIANAKLD